MIEKGKVFCLFNENEADKQDIPGVLEIRSEKLIDFLRGLGYTVRRTYWDRDVYSIKFPSESGYDEIGELNGETIWTNGNEKLENILRDFKFQ